MAPSGLPLFWGAALAILAAAGLGIPVCPVIYGFAMEHVLLLSFPPASASGFSAVESKFDYEYLVKFKSMSYIHVQWLSAHDIGIIFA